MDMMALRRRVMTAGESTAEIYTATGSIASFETNMVRPLKFLEISIEPVQDLHGYGHPWPAGGGKNKFNVGALSNTADITISDGNIIVKGASKNSGKKLKEIADLVVGETYILTATTTGTNNFIYLYGTNESWYFTNQRTVTQQDLDSTVFFYGIADASVSITISNMMIRLSAVTDATFSPYSNICPISGHTGAEIEGTGVNVWDEEWEKGSIDNDTGEDVATVYSFRCKQYIRVVPGGSYYIKGTGLRVFGYDSNKNYTGIIEVSATDTVVTMGSSVNYIRFRVNESAYGGNISINSQSSDHNYHAYNGNQISVTFPNEAGTVYGGLLSINQDRTGELVADMAMVDLGMLNWMYSSSAGRSLFASLDLANRYKPSGKNNIPVNAMFECYLNVEMAATFKNGEAGLDGDASSRIVICDNRYTDAAAFKSAISGVQLCYELAAPISYQLTSDEISGILTTLYGTNNIWADTGDSTVKYLKRPNA